jgi:transcriptional regulator with XRE-family HTH domain
VKNSVIENIKTIRKEKGLSQESVAYDLGIDYSTYGKIERGKIGLSVERLSQIARILNVTVQDLYEWDKENTIDSENEKSKLKECQAELDTIKNELQMLKNQLKKDREASSSMKQ